MLKRLVHGRRGGELGFKRATSNPNRFKADSFTSSYPSIFFIQSYNSSYKLISILLLSILTQTPFYYDIFIPQESLFVFLLL